MSDLAHTNIDNNISSALSLGKALVLYVDRLKLNNFRSYDNMDLNIGANSVVLTGTNGSGKTNLLEALSFLSPGRGLRRAKLSEVTRIGAVSPWAVAGRVMTPDGMRQLGSGLLQREDRISENSADRRIGRVDGENVSSPASFGEILQIAWLTPQMDRLFIEGASGRRRFLDRLVAAYHPTHAREVNAYEKVMRDRARLLSEGNADPVWLTSLEQRMAEHGVAVAAARIDAIQKLSQAIMESQSAFPCAILTIGGDLEAELLSRPAVEVETGFLEKLKRTRSHDARSGRTSVGPHKTDLLVRHAAKDMPAELCSTGEQKALLIGIILASARLSAVQFGAPPLLLLDEVAAHLDEERRGFLFEELRDLGSQVWLTGTDQSLFKQMKNKAKFFHFEGGLIAED
ncbi:MAG TPA: DNA replication/repair protein RecF [Emcibacteraceae bacterium]|nr:DNA replication/repair protein RecF [Emcibacteraceae bacterium]HRW28885.1 DNA replication/repair protein RecF [Emcibacteraceae bacterium]